MSRISIAFVLAALLALPTAAADAKLPRGWPRTLQIGVTSQPGTAAALEREAPFGLRYQYLAGGVNTGSGWATWNANGTFVSRYIAESRAAHVTPVFTYYQLLQSQPATGGDEKAKDIANLHDAATMKAYWQDLALFLRRARGHKPVIAHIEPDMWGYLEQAGDVRTARAFTDHVVRLRNRLAPNVVLGWHLSIWGTGEDPTYSNPPIGHMRALAARSARFWRAAHANRFDLTFVDVEDRDAGFNAHINGDPDSAWDAADYARNAAYLRAFHARTQHPLVIWQIPLGNSSLPDTWGRFRDNRVETWLGQRPQLVKLRNAGVVALLFGGGADGTTSPTTDGGLFFRLSAAYYRDPLKTRR
jgi:hypothetical protein